MAYLIYDIILYHVELEQRKAKLLLVDYLGCQAVTAGSSSWSVSC